eukprot:jgi/Astpho2/1100/e_gw1.00020.34.1_t
MLCAADHHLGIASSPLLKHKLIYLLYVLQVTMQTLADSELGVSRYPIFSYDSRGGGGLAKAEKRPGNKLFVSFDLAQLSIPDVNWRTAKFLGVPMAPPFRMLLQGTIDRETGQAELEFIADFMFTAGFLYKAPPLKVTTNLTTEHVKGTVREGDGKRLDNQGYSRLVGVATVPKTGSTPIDKFLSLPNEAYAVMSSRFSFHAADTPDEAVSSK